MVRNSTNTRRVPVDQTMFASRSGGVTLVSEDDQIWQSELKSDGLVPVDRSIAMSKGMKPPLDAADFPNEIRMGTNRTLFQSVANSSGAYHWEAITDMHPDFSNGFKLPRKLENDAILEDSSLDEQGIVLGQFVGSYASYWRMDAIRAFWNGVELYTYEGKYLNCPDSFKRGFPATMGLEGLIYIPREDYLEDLLLTQTQRESGYPNPFHSDYSKLGVTVVDDSDAKAVVDAYNAAGPTTVSATNLSNIGAPKPSNREPTAEDVAFAYPKLAGYHSVTGRKVGDQDAEGCFVSAWNSAIFETVDLYTEPEKTFEQRRLTLETTVKPLQDAYKHLRLLPVNPILSKAWAQNAYDQLPNNAALVFNDPSNKYDGATTARDPNKPRRTYEKKDRGAPLVGWKLDGAGNLDKLIVEGTDQDKSAISVGEGELWVDDSTITSLSVYNNKMNQIKATIKGCNVPDKTTGTDTYSATKVSSSDAAAAIKAYEDDAAESHKTSTPTVSRTKRDLVSERLKNENRILTRNAMERGEKAVKVLLIEYLSATPPTGSNIPAGILGVAAAGAVKLPSPKNLMEWSPEVRRSYQRSFPISSLISYTLKKGDRTAGIEDSYALTRVTIV
jgi:hypothetical protein